MLGVPAFAHRPHSKAKEQTTPVLNEYLTGTTAVMKAHGEEGWIYLCMVMIVKLTQCNVRRILHSVNCRLMKSMQETCS